MSASGLSDRENAPTQVLAQNSDKKGGREKSLHNTRAPQAWRAFPAHCTLSKNVGITGSATRQNPPPQCAKLRPWAPAVPDPAQCRRAPEVGSMTPPRDLAVHQWPRFDRASAGFAHEMTFVPAAAYGFQPASGIVADVRFDVETDGHVAIDRSRARDDVR